MSNSEEIMGPHQFRNTEKMIGLSQGNWEKVEEKGLIHLYVSTRDGGKFIDTGSGKEFVNMSSFSYLGLNRHPKVIQGAIGALQKEQITSIGITPTRMQSVLVREVETEFSSMFDAKCLVSLSCTVATAAILPLVSSGYLVDGKPRVTVLDKRSHFCMEMMMPICADEAKVLRCPHNDMNYLEDLCKTHDRVAYVADGAYSMGGVADLEALSMLQDKYGLFLWFDDSHALSVVGKNGEGYIRSKLNEVNPLTIITGSLEKGFGCTGGIVMMNKKQNTNFINTFAGPMCWSQNLSVPNLGSIKACIDIHKSNELQNLQKALRENIAYFDDKIKTPLAGSMLPVRALVVGDADVAINHSEMLLNNGFYSAPVYFPITSRGKEGLRVMIRADVSKPDLARFCELLVNHVVPTMKKPA